MTTLLLDCTSGSTKEGFACAARALVPKACVLPPISSYAHPKERSDGGHHHHSVQEVHAAIDAAPVSEAVKQDARGVYAIIAAAEAKAHGTDVEHVHFHEVGDADAIAHVLAACDALAHLVFDEVCATPVCTGYGFVTCAHGTLSIPAPATANILVEVPTVSGSQEGELTTPTGAALVVYYAQRFIDAEAENIEADLTICCNPC